MMSVAVIRLDQLQLHWYPPVVDVGTCLLASEEVVDLREVDLAFFQLLLLGQSRGTTL
jgi:hypothetical protein